MRFRLRFIVLVVAAAAASRLWLNLQTPGTPGLSAAEVERAGARQGSGDAALKLEGKATMKGGLGEEAASQRTEATEGTANPAGEPPPAPPHQFQRKDSGGGAVGGSVTSSPPLLSPPSPQPQQKDGGGGSMAPRRRVSIFYNVFTAPGREAATAEIVREQVDVWVRAGEGLAQAHLYYVQLGDRTEVPCPAGRECTFLAHLDEGSEVETLARMHAHCAEKPTELVAYIHDKGSLHNATVNDQLRRLITDAALSPQCVGMPASCTVCSARFSPSPHFHSPGNMFLADCAYVRQLIDPRSFAARAEEAVKAHKLKAGLRWPRPSQVGIGRHASEHWVHLHPDMLPCDVYKNPAFLWGYKGLEPRGHDPSDFSLVVGPRFGFFWAGMGGWSTLEWRLEELRLLYGRWPEPSSWVWKHYSAQARQLAIRTNGTHMLRHD